MTIESAPDLPSQLAVKVMHEIGSNDPDLYGRIQETLNAALAAAPQPASETDWGQDVGKEVLPPYQPATDREALVEVILDDSANWDEPLIHTEAEFIADALLARGLRLPGGGETMAWAVVGRDGQIKHVTGNGPNLARQWAEPGDSIKRVAFRRVEGGDDAA